VDLDGFPRLDAFRDRMRAHFGRRASLSVLEVRIDGERIGFVPRELIFRPDQIAGDGSGDSQGATLPGESTGYRVVWFACRQHTPPIWLPMAYYDLRYPPGCPENDTHQPEYVP
jgi:hypothetical protein